MIPIAAGSVEGVTLRSGDPLRVIDRVTIDSRAAKPGALFIALEGTRVDGHDFLADVIAAGCAAVLCRPNRCESQAGVAVLEADEPLVAFGVLARQVRRGFGGKVIGVAGSNGKTSTKDILAALCSQATPTLATHANFNNRLGVPLTLVDLETTHGVCVCELGTSEFGELADLCAIAEPDIGIITNIGPEHLEFLGDLDGVAREEASLISALHAGADVVLPAHEPRLDAYRRTDLRTTTFGLEADADVRVVSTEDGTIVLAAFGHELRFETALCAPHQALNVAAATAAALRLGIPAETLPDAASSIALSPRRGQEQQRAAGGLVINDAYNANPGSVRTALASLVTRAAGRRTVAVLGHMAELGPESARWHYDVGLAARALGVDLVVAVGLYAEDTAAGAGTRSQICADNAAAAVALVTLVRPGDVVLLKGSRSSAIWELEEAVS